MKSRVCSLLAALGRLALVLLVLAGPLSQLDFPPQARPSTFIALPSSGFTRPNSFPLIKNTTAASTVASATPLPLAVDNPRRGFRSQEPLHHPVRRRVVHASGVLYNPDDIFVGVGYGQIAHYDAQGNLRDVLDTDSYSQEEAGMCFDAIGDLYATNFQDDTMTKFDNQGNVLAYPWGGDPSTHAFDTHPESCVLDATGNIYVGEVDGANQISKFDISGNLLATYSPESEDRGIDWIDLAADQCTMYYSSEGNSIKRFDVCTNTQLPDFATGLNGPCFALRIRPNGEVMVACASEVYRLDATGNAIQTYTTGSVGETDTFFALNLDPDGTSFWTAGYQTGNIYRIDITTGNVLAQFNGLSQVNGNDVSGLAIFAEHTATTPLLSVTPASVPADGSSTATVTLSNVPPGHLVRLISNRGSVDTLTPLSGLTDSSGHFNATVSSLTPGTAILTAQDLTTGHTFSTSTQIGFTGQGNQLPPTNGPVDIVGIDAQYPLDGRYLQGVALSNRIDVTVDWKGAVPGHVDFIMNGMTYSEPATGSGASHTFDMGSALQPGDNSLRIIAYNAADQTSDPYDASPYSIALPPWLAGLQAIGSVGPLDLSLDAHAFQASISFPNGGIDLGAPSFGPPGTDTSMSLSFGGSVEIPLSCGTPANITASESLSAKIDLLGDELGGSITASGNVQAADVKCNFSTANGTVRLDIQVYGQKNWHVLIFLANFIAPGAGTAIEQVLPDDVLSILGDVYLQGNLSGFLSSEVQTLTAAPYLQWQGVGVGGGPGVETGYDFNELGARLHIYLGASGEVAFNNPNPLANLLNLHFDHLEVTGDAGFEATVFGFGVKGDYSVSWQYPSGAFKSALRPGTQQPAWQPLSHISTPNYAHFTTKAGTQQAFKLPTSGAQSFDISAQNTITSVLATNVYTYTEPFLAVNPDKNNALLTWVYDDPSKPVGQSLEIESSYWDGSSWSTPVAVTNDTQLDGAPQVAWVDDTTAIAVWQRITATLPSTTTWDTSTANQLDIATATYDATTNSWSPVSLLTNDNALDMTPQLSRNGNGDLLTVWHQNAAGLLSGDANNPDRIMADFYNGGWGAPDVAVDNIPGLVDLSAGYGIGAATIAYTQLITPTGSLTPTLQLFTSTWDGSSWSAPFQQTSGTATNSKPQVVYNAANQPLVVWLNDDALQLLNLATSTAVTLTLPPAIGSVDEFRITQDGNGNIAAVFTAQGAKRDLYVAYYEQTHNVWGLPVQLTDDPNSESYPTAGLDGDGRLLAAYASTDITPVTTTTAISNGDVVTFTLPTEGQTDLLTLSHTFSKNLTLTDTDLALSTDHPAPGQTVTISATVQNTGDIPLDGVTIGFYDGDPSANGILIGTSTLTTTLAAGFTATLTMLYTPPVIGGPRTLYAVADPANVIPESNENDNIGHLTAFGPDLAVNATDVQYWGGSNVGLQTVIQNTGTSTAPTSTLSFYSGAITGTLAITDVVPPLGPGQVVTMTTPWNFGALAAGTYPLVAAVNQTDFPEAFQDNNVYTTTLLVAPDVAVSPYYLWDALLPDGRAVITATVSNVGSVAAPPTEAVFYVDTPFSDVTTIARMPVPALAPADATTITTTWNIPDPGTLHTIYVAVNQDRSMTETTWTNNVASIDTSSLIPTPTNTATPTDTPTATPTSTYVPPTATLIPFTGTPLPTRPPAPPTNTPVSPPATPTNTSVPPTDTPIPPSSTPTVPAAALTPPPGTPAPLTATPISPSCPPGSTVPLALGKHPRGVHGGDMLALAIRTAPKATVLTRLQVTTTKLVTTGKGKHRKHVKRTIVLYQATQRGAADAHGRLTDRLRVAYKPSRPIGAGLIVTARTGCGTAVHADRVMIEPARVLPLRLSALPHGVASEHILRLRIQALAHAQISATLQVTTSRVIVTGKGKHRKRTIRTIVLYAVTRRGIADARGRATLSLPVRYKPPKPAVGTLIVTERADGTIATRTIPLTIRP